MFFVTLGSWKENGSSKVIIVTKNIVIIIIIPTKKLKKMKSEISNSKRE